jgi:hypothetical protein
MTERFSLDEIPQLATAPFGMTRNKKFENALPLINRQQAIRHCQRQH